MKRMKSVKVLSLLAVVAMLAAVLVPNLTALADGSSTPPANLIATAKSAKLYQIAHTLDWSILTDNDTTNDVPDYTGTTSFGMVPAGSYGNEGAFFTNYWNSKYGSSKKDELQQDVEAALCDGKKVPIPWKALGVGAYADGCIGINSQDAATVSARRLGIMYDLGAECNLTGITISMNKHDGNARKIYQYSVYAGNVADKTILSNLIGHGGYGDGTGCEWVQATDATDVDGTNNTYMDLPATLNGSGQYVLIVFDFLGTDPGAITSAPDGDPNKSASDQPDAGGKIAVTEIMLEGTAKPVTPNLIATADSVKVYRVKHTLDWDATMPVDYSNTTEFGLGGRDGKTDGKFTTWMADWNKHDEWIADLYDGNTDDVPYKSAGIAAYYTGIAGVSVAWNTAVDTYKTDMRPWLTEYRYGLMYDLGASYDLSKITLSWGTDKRCAYHYSVYAGDANDKSILSNLVGKSGLITQNVAQSVSATLDGHGRYVLIMFDLQYNDPGNASDSSTDAADRSTAAGYDFTACDGAIGVTEIKLEGEERAATPNILLNNDKVKANLVHVTHALDWAETFENGDFDYESKDFELQSAFEDSIVAGWTDGDYTTGNDNMNFGYNPGLGSAHQTELRSGLLVDLGGFYDLTTVALNVAEKHIGSKRYLYDVSVYAGAVNDGSILNNRIGHGGNTSQQVAMGAQTTTSVRYVLFMFNRLGTDPGNLNDGSPTPGGTYYSMGDQAKNLDKALEGCSWANGAFVFSEVEIFGTEGVDPTDTDTATDAESGVSVQIVTYDNQVHVGKIVLTEGTFTDAQKTSINNDGMYPTKTFSFKILDENDQEITDLSGRQCKISIPMTNGEFVYKVKADGTLEAILTDVDMDTNSMVFSCSGDEIFSTFAIATFTPPEEDNGDTDDTGNAGDTDGSEGTENPPTGHAAPVAVMALLAMSGAAIFVTRKTKKN